LRQYLSEYERSGYSGIEYGDIVKAIVKLVLNDENDPSYKNYDGDNITVVNNGDYQGTLLFIIPLDTYQPEARDYLVTFVDYGSCSGCDALQSIESENYNNSYSESQLGKLMTLALHLIQRMKFIYEKQID